METLEKLLLRHLAQEAFCSIGDLQAVILSRATEPQEDSALTVVRLLAEWEDRGWVDPAEMDPAGLVTLTDKAFVDLPWLTEPGEDRDAGGE